MDLIHANLANTVFLYSLILGIWGLLRFFRKQGLNSSFWGALVIAEVLVLLQGVLGIILYTMGETPGRGGIHVLYGAVSGLSLPAVYIYTRGGDTRREMLLYGVVLVFMTVISLRAMTTGA